MIVWLASYPRSGNTFFRIILNSMFGIKTYSIYDDRNDIGADEQTAEIVGHEYLPEDFDLEAARQETKKWFIKTHALPLKQAVAEDGVIYLVRDGRECSFSLMKKLNDYSGKVRTLDDIISGNTFVGRWGEHVSAWDPANRPDTLLVHFEKLVDDPVAHIEKIAHFIEAVPLGRSIPTFEELQKVNPVFFRSGRKDSWKQIYTEAQHAAFWEYNYREMIAFGYTEAIPERYLFLAKRDPK